MDLQHALSAGSLLYEHPPLQKLLDAEPRESVARRPPATQPCVVLPPVHYTPWPPTKEGYTVTWWFQFEKLNLLSGPPSDPYKEELCLFSLMMDGETQTMECLLTRSCTFVVRLTEMPEDLGTARSSWTLGSRANQSGSRQPLVRLPCCPHIPPYKPPTLPRCRHDPPQIPHHFLPPPPLCISYALVQATVGVGTVLIWDLILIRYQM